MKTFCPFPGDVAAMYHEHRSSGSTLSLVEAIQNLLVLKMFIILLLKFVDVV